MVFRKSNRKYAKKRKYAGKRKYKQRRKLPAGLSAMRGAKREAFKNSVRVGGAHMATISALQSAVKKARELVAQIK